MPPDHVELVAAGHVERRVAQEAKRAGVDGDLARERVVAADLQSVPQFTSRSSVKVLLPVKRIVEPSTRTKPTVLSPVSFIALKPLYTRSVVASAEAAVESS